MMIEFLKLRLKFQYAEKTPNSGEIQIKTIYSNEYDGSINPAQFWRNFDDYPDPNIYKMEEY